MEMKGPKKQTGQSLLTSAAMEFKGDRAAFQGIDEFE